MKRKKSTRSDFSKVESGKKISERQEGEGCVSDSAVQCFSSLWCESCRLDSAL